MKHSPSEALAALRGAGEATTRQRMMQSCIAALVGLQAALLAIAQESSQPSLPRAQQDAFRAAMHAVAPALVRIETIGGAQPVEQSDTGNTHVSGGFRTADGPTTGVVWSSDGLILSSTFNFVRDPSIITVVLADGRRLVARLVARDMQSRLALLRVSAHDLTPATWAELPDIRSGQWAISAGFGHGSAQPAISVGIVSAVQRMSAQAVQTDAKISPANYGGPLIDLRGRVMGICVPMGTADDQFAGVDQYDSGIGFAIHAEHIRRRMPRLEAGETLQRGLLGLVLDVRDPVVGDDSAPVTAARRDAATRPSSDSPATSPATAPSSAPATSVADAGARELPPRPADGLLIVAPPRGPSASAGLMIGDVITRVDDVLTVRLVDFRRAVSRKSAGEMVDVTFRRGGEAKTLSMKLWSAADFEREAASQPASQPVTRPAHERP